MGRRGAWLLVGLLWGCTREVVVIVPPDETSLPGALVELREFTEDPECPAGGLRIVTGLDDGDPGGIAGDGVLQDEEIDASEVVCDKPPGDIDLGYLPAEPPPGPPGAHTLVLAGGSGKAGDGGHGGLLRVNLSTTARGHVGFFPTGTLDAGPVVPAPPVIDLGPNPLLVEGEVEVVRTSTSGVIYLEPGTVHVLSDGEGLWVREDQDARRITGVHVRKGAVLTLPPPESSALELVLRDGLKVDGSIVMAATTGRRDLVVRAAAIVTGPDSVIDLSGVPADEGVPGGNGGSLTLRAHTESTRTDVGTVWLEGYVRLSGTDGEGGGRGGSLLVHTRRDAYVAATVETRGGNARGATASGLGGPITVRSEVGVVIVDGVLDTRGGAGGTRGGNGGNVDLGAVEVRVAGELRTDGGKSGNCDIGCPGGAGGRVVLRANGGAVRFAGAISTRGGVGGGTGRNGTGGRGGDVLVDVGPAPADGRVASQSVWLAGPIDTSGGDGSGGGGTAGNVDIGMTGVVDSEAVVQLLGFTSFDLRGGESETSTGGEGGSIVVLTSASGVAVPITLAVDADLSGGAGRRGGHGGRVQFQQAGSVPAGQVGRAVRLTSTVTSHGGRGLDVGGHSGRVHLDASGDCALIGRFEAIGGDASDPRGTGGGAGRIDLLLDGVTILSRRGQAELSGIVRVSGGFGGSVGGSGASVIVSGPRAVLSGEVAARGGNAGDGRGGNGGWVDVDALLEPAVVTGVVDVSGGTGALGKGRDGALYVDASHAPGR